MILSRFAYIEFSDKESVRTSLALDESLFRGRQIKVSTVSALAVDSLQILCLYSVFLSHILCRWFPNEPTDQASAQQTGVSRVPDTVPGLPITTAPDLDSTVVLTAGPGVESTGQDRWAAPLPRLPWALRLHPLLIWGPSLPCPLFFGFWGLGPPTRSEGGSSCRPIQFCFLEQKFDEDRVLRCFLLGFLSLGICGCESLHWEFVRPPGRESTAGTLLLFPELGRGLNVASLEASSCRLILPQPCGRTEVVPRLAVWWA